ncbi:GAD-like domain-containing protein [Chitinivorax sp. B]|uniref:GAD-like domain-containing protein n=1 Tax=Chitinivorax sp. B TaxID=2502235 RepID=UPI002016B4A4|nr:GAD-like domain-containing protein [Chitinivorax sp. B]
MLSITLQNFVDTFQPDKTVQPVDSVLINAYRGLLPDSLLELWAKVGLGRYGDGLIQLINPDEYRALLCGWLMREEDEGDRLPIAISAFGRVFYYRRLSDDGDEDVAVLDPHYRNGNVLDWSLDAFFNDTLCDGEAIESLLERGFFNQAVGRLGPLADGQIYFYTPALALGGVADVDHLDKGDAVVHLDLLLQMALGGE